MPMQTVYLVRGDTTPVTFSVADAQGNPVDLTGATVLFSLRATDPRRLDVADAACVITDGAAGVCEWRRTANQPSAAGEYEGELEVRYVGGTIKHFPDAPHSWLFQARNAFGGGGA